jgi:Zn-dependent protease with chaperone function
MFGGGGVSSLFSTHPPLEKRIEALREMTVVPNR